jgi:hypothetical protein
VFSPLRRQELDEGCVHGTVLWEVFEPLLGRAQEIADLVPDLIRELRVL